MHRQTTLWETQNPHMLFATKGEAYRWWLYKTDKPWRDADLKRHVFINKRELIAWLNNTIKKGYDEMTKGDSRDVALDKIAAIISEHKGDQNG
jgi:hypothetical protein